MAPSGPTSVAGLRSLQLCSERATTGARTILDRIKPQKEPRLANDPSQLMYDLYNDRCDAVVYDADILGAERAAAPERYGPFAGRLVTRERYGDRVPEGQPSPRERQRGAGDADARRHARAAAEALAEHGRLEAPCLALSGLES